MGLKTVDEIDAYLREVDEVQNEATLGRYSNARDNRDSGVEDDAGNVVRNIVAINAPFCDDASSLLSSDSESEKDVEEQKYRSLVLRARVGSIEADIVVDSGSEVSAVSDKFLEKIKPQVKVPMLPVSTLAISPAFGAKKQLIKLQILLSIRLLADCNIDLDVKCLLSTGGDLNVHLCGRLDNVVEVDKNEKLTFHRYSEAEIKVAAGKAEADETSQKKLENLIFKYGKVFPEHPGCIESYVHKVEMEDDSPFNAPTYPIPFIHRNEVDRQVREMERWGVIKKQKTSYISPLVVVKKRDGSPRICIDARLLNSRIRKDFIPPPNPAELLLNFRKGVVLSTIDLTASYWQIRIHEKDRKSVL
ncbi:unnamed protein product [Acanthoscelides obtectus]|uniref:Uncharacterized protein n=1 Tax=Acanthoscelides obtectus TaxID=200917 RepID=A0A9P0LPP4_ACAOB|nr:unnamed protein product [Acanthoscelides obtectus]CAK1632254.1 Retrovirus-related Pol polyprotein from transposon opus [Acanthoscelides obtectus]